MLHDKNNRFLLILVAVVLACGLLASRVQTSGGRVVITDISDYRLELAEKLGATSRVNVSVHDSLIKEMEKVGIREGFDVGLEMSGSPLALAQRGA